MSCTTYDLPTHLGQPSLREEAQAAVNSGSHRQDRAYCPSTQEVVAGNYQLSGHAGLKFQAIVTLSLKTKHKK